jgi:hypothetical protein
MTRTLLVILAALAVVVGSFVWFVATWDAAAEQPVSLRPAVQPGPAMHAPLGGAAGAGHAQITPDPYGVS